MAPIYLTHQAMTEFHINADREPPAETVGLLAEAARQITERREMTTVAIQIGNSDDKLTQKQWACFVLELRNLVENMGQIHFWGASANYEPWQNLCCVAEFYENAIHTLKVRLTELRTKYEQDSAAVLIGETQFI